MKSLIRIVTVLTALAFAITVIAGNDQQQSEVRKSPESAVEKAKVLAFDDFDGKLGLKWDIVNPNPSNYSLSKRHGSLTITTKKGHFSKLNKNYENVFLTETPAAENEDFQITTCILSFKPRALWNQAGIVCWKDEDNYVKLVYEWAGRPAFTVAHEVEGRDHYTYQAAPSAIEKIWLRITKRGDSYQCATSTDGQSFIVHSSVPWKEDTPKHVGLFANNGSFWRGEVPDLDAFFEFFEVRSVPAGPERQAPIIIAEGKQPPTVATGTAKFSIPEANLQMPDELKPCAEHLRTIYAALKKYEKEKGSMPNWLCDLVPDYLSKEILIWPDDGPESTRLARDPKLPCSFGYQYSNTAPGPGGKTYRQWKDEQRRLCGDAVPLVRYYTDERCLNLSFDGQIYMSGLVWEIDLDPEQGTLWQTALARPVPTTQQLQQPATEESTGTAKFDIPAANLQIPDDMKECADNLRTIYSALKKYEKDKGGMPDWLSDLVPDYLNAEALFCSDDPSHKSSYWPDPNLPCSYCYELNPTQLHRQPPFDKTMLHYKTLQHRLFGDVLPIVRCFHHGRVLNLSWDGQIYTSPLFFEQLFIPNYSHRMLFETETAKPVTRDASDYENDLESFIQEMDNTYPFFDLKGIRSDWEQTKNQLREKIKDCKSDEQLLKIVTEGVLCLRDSHMWFRDSKAPVPQWPSKYYPGVSFMPATNQRVVVMSWREGLDPSLKIGTVVSKIDGKNARQYLEEQAKARWAEGGISGPQRARLFAYRIALRSENKGEKHTITILVDGQERVIEVTCDIEAGGWPHWYNRPENLKQVGSCSYTRLPSETGYVYLRRVDGSTGPGLKEAFSTYPDAKGWIIDLRGNGGGGYDNALHEALQNLPSPLAVIIDAGCMSAGETLARDLVQQGNARLFGSETAGSSSAKRMWTFPSGIASLSVPTRSRWGLEGHPIEFLGIQPHGQVEAVPEEVQRGANSAILRAEEYLAEVRTAETR